MSNLSAYWKAGLVAILFAYIAADITGLFDPPPVVGFGVTVGEKINLDDFQIASGYERLFKDAAITVVEFEPKGDKYLPDWDEYHLYVFVEDGEVFNVVASKRYETPEECSSDFDIAHTKLRDEFGKPVAPLQIVDTSVELYRGARFERASAELKCSIFKSVDSEWEEQWVNLSLSYP